MAKRNMVAVMILIVGSMASFYSYSRLSQLLPMSDADRVTKTQATITQVPDEVRFTFQAAGKEYTGSYTRQDHDTTIGTKVPVVYYTSRPNIVLQQKEYDALPGELRMLRIMMFGFALTAVIAPFGVMKHG